MPIQGLRDTSNFVADQRPKNWREAILLLNPNGSAPLTGLTSVMKSKSTDDPEFNWWEKSLPDQRLALSANISTTSQTALTVSSGALGLKDGHILRVENTGELVLVNGDPASDTAITVVRGYFGTTAATVTYAGAGVNPNLHVVGNAQEEGSLAPTGINYDPTKRYNYTQIFRNTLEMTRTASKTRLRTGDQVKEAKRECLELHSIEIEKALIFGSRYETTRNGKPLRGTGGIISFIDSGNIVDKAGANADMVYLEGQLKAMFAYGSSEKVGYCGNTALLAINRIVRKNSNFNIQSGIKEFGMNVTRLTCPFGELILKTHPLFNQLLGGTTGGTAYYGVDSWMLVLDMAELVYRYVDDTQFQKQLETNGLDGMQSGYLTECGLEIHHPKAHYLLKGLAAGIADT